MAYIRLMNVASLDLNLLTALDALLETGSVSQAADRLGVTQPAASNSLRRLRDVLGDPLLVRTGPGMSLTPRATALREPLKRALEQMRGLFEPPGFEPSTSTRRFVLMMPDLTVELLMAPLVDAIAAQAPGVRLDVIPWRSPSGLGSEFAREVDIVLSCVPDAFPGFHRQRLYVDTDVLAVREGHPVGDGLRRRKAFEAAQHIAVVGHGSREDMIDTWLRVQGVERRIALTVPTYILGLRMASRTDLVAFMPRRLIQAYAADFKLQIVPPPFDPGIDDQFLFYPALAQSEPGSQWLRALMLDVGKGLGV